MTCVIVKFINTPALPGQSEADIEEEEEEEAKLKAAESVSIQLCEESYQDSLEGPSKKRLKTEAN